MKYLFTSIFYLFFFGLLHAQTGINVRSSSAELTIKSEETSPTSKVIKISNPNQETFSLQENGTMGINVSQPLATLHIKGIDVNVLKLQGLLTLPAREVRPLTINPQDGIVYVSNTYPSLSTIYASKSSQTILNNNAAQLITFSEADRIKENYVQFNAVTSKFKVLKTGSFELEAGLVFNPQHSAFTSNNDYVCMQVEIQDNTNKVIGSGNFTFYRNIGNLPVYISTGAVFVNLTKDQEIAVYIRKTAGTTSGGTSGGQIAVSSFTPTSKFIKITRY